MEIETSNPHLSMNNDIYTIKTEQFEGPFHLLLHLVENRKLFINDLSLAQVTEDYLKYVNNPNNLNTAQISSFIVIAATLILIKSKSLLPNLNLSTEEKGDVDDLEKRLKLYEMYSTLSLNIKSSFGKHILFQSNDRKNKVTIFSPNEQITREKMCILINQILQKIPKKKNPLPEVEVKKVISIEEMIEKLTERIQNSINMNFKEFSGNISTKEDKVFVIIGFLAMLELVKEGFLNVIQENNFEDILLEKNNQ